MISTVTMSPGRGRTSVVEPVPPVVEPIPSVVEPIPSVVEPVETKEKSASKCTNRLSGARPERRWVAASLRPSPSATISSTVRPTSALFSLQVISLTNSVSRW